MKTITRLTCLFLAGIFLLINETEAGTVTGTVTAKGIKSPEGVVVYIEKVKGKEFSPSNEKLIMDQIDLVFIPHVMPVVKGTTVRFRNSDTVLHNVFAVGDDEFDLGTWKGDEIRDYTFNKLGEVAILCNVHPEMEAYVVVLQNPYFALTDKEGKYTIKDIPVGTYSIKTWHDRLKPVTKKIEVPAQGEVAVDYKLKR